MSLYWDTYQISIENQKKKPALFLGGFSDSVTHCSSSLPPAPPPPLWMFPILSEVSFFYSIHTTIVSNLSLGHTQLLIYARTHLHMFTWSQTNITTLQGRCATQIHVQRHTQLVCMYPWGGVVASVAAWCFISRTTHYYSDSSTVQMFSCFVNTAKSTLYASRGQTVYEHTSVMKKWNDLWMNPLHDHIFYSPLMCFFLE